MDERSMITAYYTPMSSTDEEFNAIRLRSCLASYERELFSHQEIVAVILAELKDKTISRYLHRVQYSKQKQASERAQGATELLTEVIAGRNVVENLIAIGLKPQFLLSPAIVQAIPVGSDALMFRDSIVKIQEIFVMSLLKILYRLSFIHARLLLGDGIEVSDLFNEGVKAALNASLSFDHTTKVRWLAYAGVSVRGALKKFIAEKNRSVLAPRVLVERLSKVKGILDLPEDEQLEALDTFNQSSKIGAPYTLKDLESLRYLSSLSVSSLSASIGVDCDLKLEDTIVNTSPPLEHSVAHNMLRVFIRETPVLSDQEKNVLINFSLGDGDIPVAWDAEALERSAIKKLQASNPQVLRDLLEELA